MLELWLYVFNSLKILAVLVFVAVCGLSCPAAGGILVPWPGIEPTLPVLEDGFYQ